MNVIIHGGNNVITETADKVVSKSNNYSHSNSKLAKKVAELEKEIRYLKNENELLRSVNLQLTGLNTQYKTLFEKKILK